MGLIISRFRRKKTTTDILENLETQIKSIEQDGQYKEATHKRVIGYVMAYSVALYLLFAVLYYFMFAGRSQHWLHALLHASPLLILPVLVVFLRSAISWYYNWSLNKDRAKLKKMREEKKKILEEVMNTETYKVAKEILDKYGSPDEQCIALKPFAPLSVQGNSSGSPVPSSQLRQRLAIQNSSTPVSNNNMIVPVNSPVPVYKGPRLTSAHLPRPLPDRNRSALDKVVDYLLKDGPNHRMALICSGCHAHNGMAMAEEFEYVSYICAYCGHMNAARKQRPVAPPLTPVRALPPAPRRPLAVYCGHMNAARKQRPVAPPLTPVRALPPAPRRPLAGGGDDSLTASSGSDSEGEKNDDNIIESGEGEPNRPSTPVEGEPKTEQEKKED